MLLDDVLAGALLLSVVLFALAGGADFGGGVWTLLSPVLAGREKAGEERKLVDEAIGPIWEANELWIIVTIVILWTGFTDAFVAYGISLFVPVIMVLAGIVFRGAFFAFRNEAQEEVPQRPYRVFGTLFGAVSLITPIFFGLTAGAIASGRIRTGEDGRPITGYFEPWLGPFPLVVGLLALATCAYLAATYLTLEANGQPALQEDFRRRGIAAGLILGAVGAVALPVAAYDAPDLWAGLTTRWPALAFMGVTALALTSSLVLLYGRRYWWARTAAILEVAAVLGAWAAAQYPYLLVPDITIQAAASPRPVLVAMLVLCFFYATVLGPSLWFFFRLFKSSRSGAGR